jgi:hypothetical protein
MPDWKPQIFTAFKDLDKGDHVEAVGKLIPHGKVLDDAVKIVRGSGAPSPRYFISNHDGCVYFGEWGRLTERLGIVHPYAVDGPDMHGRPIKYFQSFSAPEGTAIPSRAWLEAHQDWFKQELDKIVRAINENPVKEGFSKKINGLASLPPFQEGYEYGENAWDRMAQRVNAGERLEHVFLPDIEKSFPNILEQVDGIQTESGSKKNWTKKVQAEASHAPKVQVLEEMAAQSPNSSECWAKNSRNIFRTPFVRIGGSVVALVGVTMAIREWYRRSGEDVAPSRERDGISH